MALLQPNNHLWQFLLTGVSPFVKLVCKAQHHAKGKEEGVYVIPVLNIFWALVVDDVADGYQGQECHQKIVGICFDKVVAKNGERIDVVLTKWTNESLQEKNNLSWTIIMQGAYTATKKEGLRTRLHSLYCIGKSCSPPLNYILEVVATKISIIPFQ